MQNQEISSSATPRFKARIAHAVILLLLLSVVPLASSFEIQTPTSTLSKFAVGLILLGWLAPLVPVATYTATMFKQKGGIHFTEYASVFLATITLGWGSFPYWINGVYHRCLTSNPPTDSTMDPKSLVPLRWLAHIDPDAPEMVAMALLLLIPLTLLAGIALSVFAVIHLCRREYTVALWTAVGVGIALGYTFWLRPFYGDWIGD